MEITLWFVDGLSAEPTLSIEDKLDRILHELLQIRAAVAELRSQRRSATSSAQPLAAGQTLLDFDIDTDEGG